jgi:hypothetical protein
MTEDDDEIPLTRALEMAAAVERPHARLVTRQKAAAELRRLYDEVISWKETVQMMHDELKKEQEDKK